MNIKLKIFIIINVMLVGGCDMERERGNEISQYINEATVVYRNDGLLGVINLVNDCPLINKKNLIKCIVYDYTGHYIDKGMVELNGFPIDNFFKDEEIYERVKFLTINSIDGDSLDLEALRKMKKFVYMQLNGKYVD